MIILDTSGLLAALDSSQNQHQSAAAALRAASAPRLLSPFVLAELDYLLITRVGTQAARRFLQEVADGVYQLDSFNIDDVVRATAILDKYPALRLGIADASIVILAERYGTRDVLTLDERHFRTVRDASGRSFRLLPADLAA